MSKHARRVVTLCVAMASLALGGCAGTGGDAMFGGMEPTLEPLKLGAGCLIPQTESAPLALPGLAELERVASGVPHQVNELFTFEPITIRGDGFALADADASINPDRDATALPAGSNESTWVVYQFQGLASDAKLGYIETAIADATPQVLYYALADYDTQSWDWFALDVPDLGELEGVFSRSLEAGGDYISDEGQLYFAVATWDGAHCLVLRSSLHIGVRQGHVQGLTASDGVSTDEIAISWEELAGASGYELYFRLAEFPGPLILLTEVAGGDVVQFSHSDVSPPDYPALKDTQYIYFIMALFPDGYRSQLSGWDTGYRGDI